MNDDVKEKLEQLGAEVRRARELNGDRQSHVIPGGPSRTIWQELERGDVRILRMTPVTLAQLARKIGWHPSELIDRVEAIKAEELRNEIELSERQLDADTSASRRDHRTEHTRESNS